MRSKDCELRRSTIEWNDTGGAPLAPMQGGVDSYRTATVSVHRPQCMCVCVCVGSLNAHSETLVTVSCPPTAATGACVQACHKSSDWLILFSPNKSPSIQLRSLPSTSIDLSSFITKIWGTGFGARPEVDGLCVLLVSIFASFCCRVSYGPVISRHSRKSLYLGVAIVGPQIPSQLHPVC